MSADEFKQSLYQTADRILEALSSEGSAPGKTAWQLKMELKLSNAQLFMALGVLAREDQITIEPQELTFKVRRHAPATIPSQR